MGCGVKWQQVQELDRALGSLRRAGLGPGDYAYNELWKIRGRVFGQIGYKFPRAVTLLLNLVALSPGSIKLFHDVEAGWLVEARAKPGAQVVRRYVSDDIATTLLTGKLTHELEEFLMAPDPYIGE